MVHTPGHTPGHISLLHKEKRFLITGDALANRGGNLRPPPNLFTPDEKNAAAEHLEAGKKYGDDFEVMVFGHGPPIMQNASKRVKGLVSQIFSTDV